jgi:hypothetical protein
VGTRGSFPGLEADHSPPSNAEVKECVELYLHSPICFHGVVLSSKEHRENFTFSFIVIDPAAQDSVIEASKSECFLKRFVLPTD